MDDFERQKAALRADPEKLARAKAEIRHSFSVVAPVNLCVECGGQLIQRFESRLFYSAPIQEGAVRSTFTGEMVGITYYSCDGCKKSFVGADQFEPLFVDTVIRGGYTLTTGGGAPVWMVEGKAPYVQGSAPLNFTTKQRKRAEEILALPGAP